MLTVFRLNTIYSYFIKDFFCHQLHLDFVTIIQSNSCNFHLKVGHGKDLLPALQRAKDCGLKLSLHLSEV